MTASTSSTEPSAISNRLKTRGIANGPNPKGMVGPPASMSKISQSAELDEYTASMRNYLAGVENSRCQSTRDRRSESVSSNSNVDSSGSDREKSPEFQWMDLAAVRRAHGAVDLNRLPNTNGLPKSLRTKQLNQPGSPSVGLSKDSRHHLHQHRQRENRSISPGIEGVKKKHISYTRRSQLHLQSLGVRSSQKDCT
ncbi:hypothetical protein PV08_04564 [Exophiala spinifera]|uniref:Uncharacterized protein n=1 Tax=Exophiala spinifera TaxID=91928 RepID=A0A0D2BFI8_9EURO|nr:uncharacterized protein PV08_04564 [Exophiala spinifera]KIW17370.1 hypothetical protein PV08_04564 [Exophiala spinifera]